MTTQQPTITVIIPLDVDDPDGYGVAWALRSAGIDRDDARGLVDAVEDAWWRCYSDAAEAAAIAAGCMVVRTAAIGSPDCIDAEREHPDAQPIGDVVDMDAVNEAAQQAWSDWWTANAEDLVRQHCVMCPVCDQVEETCDCIILGDDVRSELAERMDAGEAPTDAHIDRLVELLEDEGLLARRDDGGWMLHAMQDEQFRAFVAQTCDVDGWDRWWDALRMRADERNVARLCRGFDFEAFRDRHMPDVSTMTSMAEIDAALAVAADTCIDEWLAMTPAERKAAR
jgi:hypothetical protein